MNSLEDLPPSVHRAIVVSILVYFALVIYAQVAGSVVAGLVANVLFGFIALGVGAALFLRAEERYSTLAAAGFSLITGGIAQLLEIVLRDPAFGFLATIAIFFGIGLYVYAVWFSD